MKDEPNYILTFQLLQYVAPSEETHRAHRGNNLHLPTWTKAKEAAAARWRLGNVQCFFTICTTLTELGHTFRSHTDSLSVWRPQAEAARAWMWGGHSQQEEMRRVRRKGGHKDKVFGCDLLEHLNASSQESKWAASIVFMTGNTIQAMVIRQVTAHVHAVSLETRGFFLVKE